MELSSGGNSLGYTSIGWTVTYCYKLFVSLVLLSIFPVLVDTVPESITYLQVKLDTGTVSTSTAENHSTTNRDKYFPFALSHCRRGTVHGHSSSSYCVSDGLCTQRPYTRPSTGDGEKSNTVEIGTFRPSYSCRSNKVFLFGNW